MGRAAGRFGFVEEVGAHAKSLSDSRAYALIQSVATAFFIDNGRTPVVLSRALYAGPYLEVRRHFQQRVGRARRA